MNMTRRRLVRYTLGGLACLPMMRPLAALAAPDAAYVCPPCGCAADGKRFKEPGNCPACGMALVAEDRAAMLGFEPEMLPVGRSEFIMRGGPGREDQSIAIHCYRPESFDAQAPILIVVPGTGRGALSYLESWIAVAEARHVLVAAPNYPAEGYDFAAYHMGGVIKDFTLSNVTRSPDGELPSSLYLRDEDIRLTPNPDRTTWLFEDFDRLFAILARASGSTRRGYDLFGHSAGGQILHRLALFHPETRAERIVAANSGFYTLPDATVPLPFGLKGLEAALIDLPAAFRKRLTILLGELDNDPDVDGQHLHTPLADRQGLGRLARGQYFFATSQQTARRLGASFKWQIQVVPSVGHEQRKMALAAAELLYGSARAF